MSVAALTSQDGKIPRAQDIPFLRSIGAVVNQGAIFHPRIKQTTHFQKFGKKDQLPKGSGCDSLSQDT